MNFLIDYPRHDVDACSKVTDSFFKAVGSNANRDDGSP
jgi:hypothetical protein